MAWFLCTVARGAERNWELCKEVGLWGMSTHGSKINFDRVQADDRLLVWMSGQGYVAHARVTGPMRRPRDPSETPWPEGMHRYGAVVPMSVELELKEPLMLRFTNQRQNTTNISLFHLRRGFIAIDTEAAESAVRGMEEKKAKSEAGAATDR